MRCPHVDVGGDVDHKCNNPFAIELPVIYSDSNHFPSKLISYNLGVLLEPCAEIATKLFD